MTNIIEKTPACQEYPNVALEMSPEATPYDIVPKSDSILAKPKPKRSKVSSANHNNVAVKPAMCFKEITREKKARDLEEKRNNVTAERVAAQERKKACEQARLNTAKMAHSLVNQDKKEAIQRKEEQDSYSKSKASQLSRKENGSGIVPIGERKVIDSNFKMPVIEHIIVKSESEILKERHNVAMQKDLEQRKAKVNAEREAAKQRREIVEKHKQEQADKVREMREQNLKLLAKSKKEHEEEAVAEQARREKDIEQNRRASEVRQSERRASLVAAEKSLSQTEKDLVQQAKEREEKVLEAKRAKLAAMREQSKERKVSASNSHRILIAQEEESEKLEPMAAIAAEEEARSLKYLAEVYERPVEVPAEVAVAMTLAVADEKGDDEKAPKVADEENYSRIVEKGAFLFNDNNEDQVKDEEKIVKKDGAEEEIVVMHEAEEVKYDEHGVSKEVFAKSQSG